MHIVQRRIEQGVGLHRDRGKRGLGRFDRLPLRRSQRQPDPGGRARHGGVHPAQHQISGRHHLRIVEEHHLGPAPGQHVALQIDGQHQQSQDAAGEDHVAAFGELRHAHRDGRVGSRIHEADHRSRELGTVEVEHADRQPGRETGAEYGREQRRQHERHKRGEGEKEGAAPQPTELPPEYQPEAGCEFALNGHVSAPVAPSWQSRSSRDAIPRPDRWASRGLRKCAGRNHPSRAWHAMSRTAPGR